ncbi:hypothetical protein INR49_007873 [Caranx melampygus]|nr:hypothetical protein INR49_007873 [Caranx melampygus]
MSVDEPDAGSQETPSGEDSTPTMTTLVPPPPSPRRSALWWNPPASTTPEHGERAGAGTACWEGRQDSLSEDRLCSQLDKLVTTGVSTEGTSPSLSSYTVRTGLKDHACSNVVMAAALL